MIYTLKVELIWSIHGSEDCVRVIEIPEECTLMDLHWAIQKAVRFDDDHLFEFYAGRNPRNKASRFADSLDCEDRIEEYVHITLKEVFPLDGMKLYYHFDFGDDWLFEIKKDRKLKTVESKIKYPRVIEKIGPNPIQYPY